MLRWSANARLNDGRAKRASGRPVVTAFQDLCLGASLSDVLLLLPFQCVVGDTTKKTKQKNRTEQEGTTSPVGHFPQRWLCCQGNLVSLKHTGVTELSDLCGNVCYTWIDWEYIFMINPILLIFKIYLKYLKSIKIHHIDLMAIDLIIWEKKH